MLITKANYFRDEDNVIFKNVMKLINIIWNYT